MVRPGPYICAEWSNGGLPSWLTARDVAIRSSDPAFTSAVGRWFDELIPRVAALQAAEGGPVVAVQVENEFGSYGDDHAYLRWIRQALIARGIRELLFTADGPTELMLDAGTLPDTLAASPSAPDRTRPGGCSRPGDRTSRSSSPSSGTAGSTTGASGTMSAGRRVSRPSSRGSSPTAAA